MTTSGIATKIKYGDGLDVTDEGGGVIRVDGTGGPAGTTGPPGPTGPTGPTGAPTPTYVFTQGTAAATWTITHNLGMFPSVTVVDSGGTEIWPTVSYTNTNTVTLTFGSATSGKAYLN